MTCPNSCHSTDRGKNSETSFVSCKNIYNAKFHVKSLGSYELSVEAAITDIGEAKQQKCDLDNNTVSAVGAVKSKTLHKL